MRFDLLSGAGGGNSSIIGVGGISSIIRGCGISLQYFTDIPIYVKSSIEPPSKSSPVSP